jgi:hypothetical protein
VVLGRTGTEPLAKTVPMPPLICTDSAPATSQVNMTVEPETTSLGVAKNFWIERESGPVSLSVRPHAPQEMNRRIVARRFIEKRLQNRQLDA